eukprot:scaffold13391_cov65-Phaeocystis_antarctica.AAC.4
MCRLLSEAHRLTHDRSSHTHPTVGAAARPTPLVSHWLPRRPLPAYRRLTEAGRLARNQSSLIAGSARVKEGGTTSLQSTLRGARQVKDTGQRVVARSLLSIQEPIDKNTDSVAFRQNQLNPTSDAHTSQWSECASAAPKRHRLASSREARPAWSPTDARHADARRTVPCFGAAPRSSVPPRTRGSMQTRRNGKKWSAIGPLSARHRPGARQTCREGSDESYQACAALRDDKAESAETSFASRARLAGGLTLRVQHLKLLQGPID